MPSPQVNEDLTRRIAALARLKLSDEEVGRFTRQLASVLEYVVQLEEVKVDGVEPLVHPFDLDPALRDDTPRDAARAAEYKSVLTHAPAVENDGFQVPAIL